MTILKVAVLGNIALDRPARRTIIPALEHAAATLGVELNITPVSNEQTKNFRCEAFDGLFIAPGAPEEDAMEILQWIRTAREQGIPCLGTCGGSQRMILEFAKHVLKLPNTEHAEINPDADDPLFSELVCGLGSMRTKIVLLDGSRIQNGYQQSFVEEEHYCGYGLNEQYVPQFEKKGLKVTGRTQDGEVRVVELDDHPFFIGTAFVPQVLSTVDAPHPLILAWLVAVKKDTHKPD